MTLLIQHTMTKRVLSTRNACAIILKVAYGYPMGGYEDEFVSIIEEGFAITADLATPGKWFVEFALIFILCVCIFKFDTQ